MLASPHNEQTIGCNLPPRWENSARKIDFFSSLLGNIRSKHGGFRHFRTEWEAAAIAERERGMAEKSAEFLENGGRLYV
jgi:hypothetical protein